MKSFMKKASNVLIYILIFITIFSFWKSLKGTYYIKYTEDSKNAIHDFILISNMKLKNKKEITNVTMDELFPYGHRYTIYYIDNDNQKQSKQVSLKSDNFFKKYMLENGENIGKRYMDISKISMITCIGIVIVKAILIRIKNYKDKCEVVS